MESKPIDQSSEKPSSPKTENCLENSKTSKPRRRTNRPKPAETKELAPEPLSSQNFSSLSTFNNMVYELLSDLMKVYNDEKQLRHVHANFWNYVSKRPALPKKWFDETFGKYGQLIQEKNPELFSKCPTAFHGVDIHKLWHNASQDNKEVIWKYFQFLHQYSTMLNMIPTETLPQIDNMVNNVMQNIDVGALGQLAGNSSIPLNSDMINAALGMFMGGLQ